jgi:hypothetical protein
VTGQHGTITPWRALVVAVAITLVGLLVVLTVCTAGLVLL